MAEIPPTPKTPQESLSAGLRPQLPAPFPPFVWLIKCEFALLCRLMVCFLVARQRRLEVVNGQQLTGADGEPLCWPVSSWPFGRSFVASPLP